jgi:hypothetical protein
MISCDRPTRGTKHQGQIRQTSVSGSEGTILEIGGAAQENLKAFVIMPFDSSFDDVHDVIKSAVAAVDMGLSVVRLDEFRAAGRISDDLVQEISTAAMCVADVTGGNPNVMWEVGFATALKKPLVVINQKKDRLPFDIADMRAVIYERSALAKTLKEPLTAAIRETLKRYSVASTTVAVKIKKSTRQSVAVTGTMNCPPDIARSRLEKVLHPYLGREIAWFVGSYGTIDEVAVKLLLDAGEETVTVVGYSAYDISGPMLAMLEEFQALSFLDASAEQVPTSPGAPSTRDILFAARCSMLVIGWDGVSIGTRKLINWLAKHDKDHLVAFTSPHYYEHTERLVR